MKAVSFFLMLALGSPAAFAADWSDYDRKDVSAKGDDESCPSGLFRFNKGKTTSLIRIGANHTLEWHPDKSVETENPEGGCSYSFESQGDDHEVRILTRHVKCPVKKLDGSDEEVLTRAADDSLIYTREKKDAAGKLKSKLKCILRVDRD